MADAGIAVVRFELFVKDRARSIEFYERALGFELEQRAGRVGDYVQIVNGAVRIGLCEIASLSPDHYFRANGAGRWGVGVEIVFEVDDLTGYERRARLAGAVYEGLRFRPWGRHDLRVVDPDGYYVRVTETR
jgi:lactoylglutathione lyase